VNPTAGTYWETSGNQTTLTATANPGYIFDGWSGTGPGSMNATTSTLVVTTTAPMAEAAVFSVFVPGLPATYVLTVTETGLPSGTSWSFSAGFAGAGSTGSTASVGGLNGTYSVSAPTVPLGSGEQFVSNVTNRSILVTSDTVVLVGFSEQFLLSVVHGVDGTATPGTEWASNGAAVPIAATAEAGYQFVGWNGTGPGNYTGDSPSGTVTVNGPVTERAEFAAALVPRSGNVTGGGTSHSPFLAAAAFVALLVVGVVSAYVIDRGRQGGRPPSGASEETKPTAPAAEGRVEGSPPGPATPSGEGTTSS
jgi:hypothetical protein